jgi:hypothetical protein
MRKVYAVTIDGRKVTGIHKQAPLVAKEQRMAAAEALDLLQRLALDVDSENFQGSTTMANEQQFSGRLHEIIRQSDVIFLFL